MVKESKKMGRPRKPEYRKTRIRFGALEDAFMPILARMNGREKDEILQALEDLKATHK